MQRTVQRMSFKNSAAKRRMHGKYQERVHENDLGMYIVAVANTRLELDGYESFWTLHGRKVSLRLHNRTRCRCQAIEGSHTLNTLERQ